MIGCNRSSLFLAASNFTSRSRATNLRQIRAKSSFRESQPAAELNSAPLPSYGSLRRAKAACSSCRAGDKSRSSNSETICNRDRQSERRVPRRSIDPCQYRAFQAPRLPTPGNSWLCGSWFKSASAKTSVSLASSPSQSLQNPSSNAPFAGQFPSPTARSRPSTIARLQFPAAGATPRRSGCAFHDGNK